MRKIVHASLFSGFGGPDLAAEWMGWNNAFHCEINEFCNTILEYWFPESKTYKDVTTADFTEWRGKIDILTGGFPCQPFSVAGQRKGADDNRYLWPHFLRVIREVRPTWVVGENVGGILTMVQPGEEVEVGCQASLFGEGSKETILEQEYVVETICKDLEREGYSVQPILIPACAVGAPHRRDRIWFIAYRTDAGIESVQPRWEDGVLSGTSITDTYSNDAGRSGYEKAGCKTGKGQTRKREWEWLRCNIKRIGKERIITDTYGKRCNNRSDNWEERPIYYDWQWYSEKDQSERDKREYRTREACADDSNTTSEGFQRTMRENTKLFTEPFRNFPTQSPVCSRNDGISSRLDGITFPKWRQESVKGFGNAIVPQVIYELFKVVEEIEEKII